MQPESTPLVRLASIVEAVGAGVAPASTDAAWLAQAVLAMRDDKEVRLDTALGLASTWRRDLRHVQRDARLRRLAADLPGLPAAKAAALQAMLRDYQSRGWPRDSHLATLPASASMQNRLLHEVMRLDSNPPTTVRQLTTIIGD